MKRVVPVAVAVFAAATLLTGGCGGGSSSSTSPTGFSSDAPSLVKSAIPTNQTAQDVKLAFQTVSNADQYEVEFSDNPNFTDPTVEPAFFNPNVADTATLTPVYNLGDKYKSATKLYYRVGSRNSLNADAAHSAIHYSTSDFFTQTGGTLSPSPESSN